MLLRRLMFDAGLGFAKTAEQSLELLALHGVAAIRPASAACRRSFAQSRCSVQSPASRFGPPDPSVVAAAWAAAAGLTSCACMMSPRRALRSSSSPRCTAPPPIDSGRRRRSRGRRMKLAAASLISDLYGQLQSGAARAELRDLLTTTADVLIVYYVVFRILAGARHAAAQTLTGMFVLGGLFFIAKRLDLFAVSWLFEKLIDYFIIFFVVIFQQDLRRALMQVGQACLSPSSTKRPTSSKRSCKPPASWQKKNIGGLIVIERDADLSEHLGEVGVELDARVTKGSW